MPWQAQLFIGERVHDDEEAKQVFIKLGVSELDGQKIETLTGDELEEALWNMGAVDRFAWVPTANGEHENKEVQIMFRREGEGGCSWPVERDEDYSDAIVGFALTTRYAPGILTRKGSRPEPFEFDPQDILDILESVHAWWPDAKALLWSVLHAARASWASSTAQRKAKPSD